jgi:hypothetical protein
VDASAMVGTIIERRTIIEKTGRSRVATSGQQYSLEAADGLSGSWRPGADSRMQNTVST